MLRSMNIFVPKYNLKLLFTTLTSRALRSPFKILPHICLKLCVKFIICDYASNIFLYI
jgi:hypothetical protein